MPQRIKSMVSAILSSGPVSSPFPQFQNFPFPWAEMQQWNIAQHQRLGAPKTWGSIAQEGDWPSLHLLAMKWDEMIPADCGHGWNGPSRVFYKGQHPSSCLKARDTALRDLGGCEG